MPSTDSLSTPGVFLRLSSGLTKSASILDVFIYNVGLVSIGIGLAFTHSIGPANYPGGSIWAASLIATALMLAVGWALWFWSVALPRSGGIYVYLTRGVHPALGFPLSFVESCCWQFYNAVAAVLFTTVGIAPLVGTVGLVRNDSRIIAFAKTFESPHVQFVVGAVSIALCGIVLTVGMRTYFRVQKIMFLIAVVGLLALLALLAVSDRAAFVERFNALSRVPGGYDGVLAAAHKAGWHYSGFQLGATVRLSVWPFLPLIGGAFSIAIAGEIRRVARAQNLGMIGAIAACGVVFALIGWLADAVFGYEFQAAINYNATAAPQAALPITPYLTLLAGIISGSPVLATVICLGFIAWIYFWIPGMLAYAERAMLAWSFDRLAPASFGYVSDRTHTPVVAIWVSVAVSEIFLVLYVYSSFFKTLIFILAATLAWMVTMIAGIFYPYRRRDLFEASPVAHLKLGGIPLMSVANALGALALGIMAALLWQDPLAAGHDPKSIGTVAAVFLVGFLVYLGFRHYRRRQGLDISPAFKQLPIE